MDNNINILSGMRFAVSAIALEDYHGWPKGERRYIVGSLPRHLSLGTKKETESQSAIHLWFRRKHAENYLRDNSEKLFRRYKNVKTEIQTIYIKYDFNEPKYGNFFDY